MSLITRTGKGSKLTIEEMDGNINTLASASLVDGVYTITSGSRTDSITALASGSIEVKSFSAGDGSVTAESLTFDPTTFETDTIVVGTYTGIQPTGGSGTGLTVDVVVNDRGGGPEIASTTVTAGGSGYISLDVVSIATSELGAETSTESTTCKLYAEDLNIDQQQRILMTPTGISMPDLPESDPDVAGQLWVDPAAGYAVKRSRS